MPRRARCRWPVPKWLREKAVNSGDIEWLEDGTQGGVEAEKFALLQRLYA
jgi:hypothetical protein